MESLYLLMLSIVCIIVATYIYRYKAQQNAYISVLILYRLLAPFFSMVFGLFASILPVMGSMNLFFTR